MWVFVTMCNPADGAAQVPSKRTHAGEYSLMEGSCIGAGAEKGGHNAPICALGSPAKDNDTCSAL